MLVESDVVPIVFASVSAVPYRSKPQVAVVPQLSEIVLPLPNSIVEFFIVVFDAVTFHVEFFRVNDLNCDEVFPYPKESPCCVVRVAPSIVISPYNMDVVPPSTEYLFNVNVAPLLTIVSDTLLCRAAEAIATEVPSPEMLSFTPDPAIV
jgi:hypothetical protein